MARTFTERVSSWFRGTKLGFDLAKGRSRVVNGNLIFGAVTGEPDDILHEMAHMVEIDDARCLDPGWGLTLPPVEVCGRTYFEASTFSPCAREIRVFGIQRVLSEYLRVDFDEYSSAKLVIDFVDGAVYIKSVYPEVIGWDSKAGLVVTQQSHYKRVAQAIVDESAKWTIERVRAEWDRKCAIHEQHGGLQDDV